MTVRRRPLADCSLAEMLRRAASEEMSGSIEIRADIGGIICLEDGRIYFAALDRAPLPDLRDSEELRRSRLAGEFVAALAAMSGQKRGWYFLTPHRPQLGDDGGSILFDVEELLEEMERRLARCAALASWTGHMVDPRSPEEPEVRLDADMWAVVGAMVSPVAVHQLVDRLGWDPDRIASALDRLGDAQLVSRPTHAVRRDRPQVPAPGNAAAGPPAAASPAAALPEPEAADESLSNRDAIGQLRTLSILASAAVEAKVPTGAVQVHRAPAPRTVWNGAPDLTIRRLPPPSSVVDPEHTRLPSMTPAPVVEEESAGARKKALARLIASLRR